ncbi:MAG: LysR substrate-binding domain-containing protein [Flavobacteriaceae bacterium]
MISLRQLRYVDALARHRHFGQAAEAAGVTQPALSMQIRELENALGGALFERTPAGAVPTPLGLDVAERASRVLAEIADLEALGQGERALALNRLRLGVIPSIAPYLLPTLLPLVEEELPQLRMSVREAVTDALVDDLAGGRIDVVIASLPLEQSGFVEEAAFIDEFFLAVPLGSPLAGLDSIAPSAVAANELILLEDGHCLRDQALSVCRRVDPAQLREFGASSMATILQMVAAGHGVTLAPRLCFEGDPAAASRRAVVPVEAPAPSRTGGLAWRRTSPGRARFGRVARLVARAGAGAGARTGAGTGAD